MISYKKSMSWIVIVTFFVSLFSSTGALYPKAASAYDAPPKDQGHSGPNPPPPPPKEPPPEQCPITGSPVHLRTGNYFYSHRDLFIPSGCDMSLEITRQYHSQNAYEGPFGYGWSFDLLMELIMVKEGEKEYATIRKGEGFRLKFEKNEDGTFTPPEGRHDTLVQNSDGSYDLGATECPSCGEQTHFDSSGRLIYKRDGNGNQMSFSYDASGKISVVTDSYGRQLSFAYGTNNKIVQITDPVARTFSYSYDAQGNLIGYTDPLGNSTTYSYDSNHNLISVVDPHGNTVNSITYDSYDRLLTYLEGAETWSITYYPDNKQVYKRDSSGYLWRYYYNDTGQITQKTDPYGKTIYYTWDDNQNWTSKRDARGHTTTYTYDSSGNRVTETDPLGNTTTYTYDSTNNKVATITDPLGRVTRYEYNSNGNRTKIIRDYGGSLQNETVLTYDGDGSLTSMTDPLGNTTTYTYDSYGNLIQVTDALGNVTTYTYDMLGNKLTETDSRSYTTTYGYDLLGRLTSVRNALDNTTTYSYDASGNMVFMTDPVGNTVTYAHDSYNQLVQITDSLGNITQYAYDARGNWTSMTDANGNTTTYTYNAVDQLTAETNAIGHVTSYTYDGNSNRLTVTDANGNTTTNTYDALNRVTKTTYPDSAFDETVTYDAVGNIIGTTDRNGNTVSKTYDALNRLLAITYPDSTATNYTYDLNGNILTAGNADISYAFTYDALNRVTQVNNVTLGKSVSYSYLCCGLKDSMTNPEGGVTSYTYDAIERLTSLSNSFGETTTYTYDNLSRVTRKDLANGSYTNYSYDAATRLTSLVNMTSGGSVISSYAYSLDNIGNRTSMTSPAGTHNYSYDNINQLLQATHPASSAEAYTYGPVHNRLTSTDHNDWTYDNNNRLISYNGFSYTYDANGNMISKTDTVLSQVTSYQYDYENKLKRIDYPDETYSEYQYDPFGNRIKKDVNGTVTWFVYDLIKMLPDVTGEYDGGALIAGYTHGLGIDDVISMRRGGDSYYYFRDALGSIKSLSDSSETTVNNYEYYAFGSVFSKTELVVNPYGFTGRVLDNESGLMYYRMRYYDPGIGRFITADPIRFQGGINFYTYASNNPINLVDSIGLNPLSPKCQRLLKKIQNIQKKIQERLEDLKKDPLDLPERCPGDTEKPSLSRYGHREILINKDKANLARLKAKYLAECSDKPPGGTPAEDYSYFDQKYWENVTGLTGLALIIYLIISVGSRLYPPRNLVPVP